MYLNELKADNFRLLNGVKIEPHSRLNLFVGPNASGKTTILEAIYCLSRKRSFRSGLASELAGKEGRYWRASGSFLEVDHKPRMNVAVKWIPGETRLESDGSLRLAELSKRFPVQLLEPGQHRMLEDGPSYRRKFLDWGVFHVEHRFYPAWLRYLRALRQRNRALKGRMSSASAFDQELADSGELLNQLRAGYLQRLRSYLSPRLDQLLGLSDEDWALELQSGWKAECSLLDVLRQGYERDQRMGQTVEGPHRAELRLKLEGVQARNRVSRGQQKILIAGLVMAQCDDVEQATGVSPILLVDDFSAELGASFRAAFAEALSDYQGQIFVTALDVSIETDFLRAQRLFHVEHGEVRAVSPT